MAKHERDPDRERRWRAVVAQWQASGLSVRAFCAQRQLAEPSFYFWRRELLRRERRPAASAFVPLTVRPAATIEVRCPSGHVVTLEPFH